MDVVVDMGVLMYVGAMGCLHDTVLRRIAQRWWMEYQRQLYKSMQGRALGRLVKTVVVVEEEEEARACGGRVRDGGRRWPNRNRCGGKEEKEQGEKEVLKRVVGGVCPRLLFHL